MTKLKWLYLLVVIQFISLYCYSQIILAKEGAFQKCELFLLRENCKSSGFSFCGDGIEQPFRSSPYFIVLDSCSFKADYRNGVFMCVLGSIGINKSFDTVPIKGVSVMSSMMLDSIFDAIANDSNLVVIHSNYLKRKVNRLYRNLGIKERYDGALKFNGIIK